MNVYLQGNITDMQGPCAEGFHVPLATEFNTVVSIMRNLGLGDSIDDYKNYLFLPKAGARNWNDGNYSSTSDSSYRCSNGLNSNLGIRGRAFYTYECSISTTLEASGGLIRAFSNISIIPDSSWTELYLDKIYHNSELGLISLSSDGINWITIADKNLGASQVYRSGDTLSESNCGKFYQRGNNYGFPFSGSITTSSTKVDASNYGPGNYYSSSTFIVGTASPSVNGAWDSSGNLNLRGGVTGGINVLKNAYIGEVYEYSYDFRNKTKTQLANDGWTNTSSLTTGANGVTASSWNKIYNQLSGLGTAMANAKKLTMTMLMYDAGSVTTDSVAGVTLSTGTDGYTQTGFYTDISYAGAICGSASEVIKPSQSVYNTQGDYTLSAVFDFVNKTVSVVFPLVYTGSASLTDAWITTAKTNNTVGCPLHNDRYVKTISILIEY